LHAAKVSLCSHLLPFPQLSYMLPYAALTITCDMYPSVMHPACLQHLACWPEREPHFAT
ncbi:hypothetical protein L0F63_000486, partial [Massospora cicadina]